MGTKLERIAEISAITPKPEFTSLYHLINVEMLKQCLKELNGRKAVGIDKVTKEEYEEPLEENITNLVERLKNKAYKPLPSLRGYIPKSNGKMRPLGIASYEDKIVQLAVMKGRYFMFNEICIYEAKLTKLDEIEELMKEVAEFYLEQEGVIEVHYIKRTHRQKDFNAVKEGEVPVRLTKNVGKVTYVLYWVLENEEAHARVSKLGVEKFYKRWNRCLTTMPKIILGENIV